MLKSRYLLKKEKRMDLRDERVRLQRELYALKDIEPEVLTPEQKTKIQILKNKIAELRESEESLKEAV